MDDKIKKLEDHAAELENNWKRAVADYRNLQKRTEEERMLFAAMANTLLLSELLPVLDGLEAAEEHLKDEGLSLAVKKFRDSLSAFGVVEIIVLGKDFDMSTMEAVDLIDGEKDKVLEVTQKGYMLGDKILRAAKVKVGKGV